MQRWGCREQGHRWPGPGAWARAVPCLASTSWSDGSAGATSTTCCDTSPPAPRQGPGAAATAARPRQGGGRGPGRLSLAQGHGWPQEELQSPAHNHKVTARHRTTRCTRAHHMLTHHVCTLTQTHPHAHTIASACTQTHMHAGIRHTQSHPRPHTHAHADRNARVCTLDTGGCTLSHTNVHRHVHSHEHARGHPGTHMLPHVWLLSNHTS